MKKMKKMFQKSDRDRFRDIFSVPHFLRDQFRDFFGTKFFRDRFRDFFRYQFFFETATDTTN